MQIANQGGTNPVTTLFSRSLSTGLTSIRGRVDSSKQAGITTATRQEENQHDRNSTKTTNIKHATKGNQTRPATPIDGERTAQHGTARDSKRQGHQRRTRSKMLCYASHTKQRITKTNHKRATGNGPKYGRDTNNLTVTRETTRFAVSASRD